MASREAALLEHYRTEPYTKVAGPPGMTSMAELTKAFEAGQLDFDPNLSSHAARAIAEQRQKEELKNAITPVEGNDRIQMGPSTLPGFDRGVFVVNDTEAFAEVARTRPLVAVAFEGEESHVCDWCSANSEYMIDVNVDIPDFVLPDIKRCAGCKQVGYCSRQCQQKAWNTYHKVECKTYKSQVYKAATTPFINGNTRTLVRLLCMHKMDALPGASLRKLMMLPHSPDLLNAVPIHQGFVMDPSDGTRKRAKHAIDSTGSSLPLEQVSKMLAIITTQTASMCDDTLKPIAQGIEFLDTEIAHSCDPNTIAFIDEGDHRIRVVRPLKAGEELTGCFIYEADGVEARRNKLEERFGFKCECPRCLRELLEIRLASPEQKTRRDRILKAQQELNTLVMLDPKKLLEMPNPSKLELQVEKVTKKLYPDGDWPGDLHPMPLITMMLGMGYMRENKFAEAFRCSIRGALNRNKTFEDNNPRVRIEDLCSLDIMFDQFTREITRKRQNIIEGCPVELSELLVVHYGYTLVLIDLLAKVFDPKMKTVRGLKVRLDQFVRIALPADFPKPKTKEFRKMYISCQKAMLKWAGVRNEKAIRLPK